MKRIYLALAALLALSIGTLVYAQGMPPHPPPPGTCPCPPGSHMGGMGGGMMGDMMGHPMMGHGAMMADLQSMSVKNTKDGATITLVAKDAAAASRVQKRAQIVQLVFELAASSPGGATP